MTSASVSIPHENQGLSISLSQPTFVDGDDDCGLLDALIAFWFGNRAAGIADDVHTNNLDLTDVNTVTSAAGIVYPLARQYTAANLEYHTRPGDDALLSAGNTDFTIATWTYPTALVGQFVLGKSNWGANQVEYSVETVGGTRAKLLVSPNGTGGAAVSVTSPVASITQNAWNFIVAWHDSVADTINIQVDNGTVNTRAHATGVHDGTAPFHIGVRAGLWGYYDGRIGPTMFWKSAAGGGGVLTTLQRTCLWDAGTGLQYGELT